MRAGEGSEQFACWDCGKRSTYKIDGRFNANGEFEVEHDEIVCACGETFDPLDANLRVKEVER